MKFGLWRNEYREGYCVLIGPALERPWEFTEGMPRLEGFPDDFSCRMSPQYPKDIQLSDNLFGTTTPIISKRVKEVLESVVTRNRIEFLPVQIINHKGRVASADYFLLHPLDVCDCIDLAGSVVQWNPIEPTLIMAMKAMVVDESRIPRDFSLFRLHYSGYDIMVRDDIMQALEAAGLEGIVFLDPAVYTGIG